MIYVDELREFGNGKWCHLATGNETDLSELHHMAMLLGLSRQRFNGRSAVPHYPLHESRRGIALQHGVKALERSEFVRLCARGQRAEASDAVQQTVSGLAVASMHKALDRGESIEIPSLGIKIDPEKENDDEQPI